MKTWSKLVCFFLLIVFLVCQRDQTHQEVPPSEFYKTFQPSELKEDIDFLFQTLEAVHPNLYAYTPKEIIAKEREKIENGITSPLTRIDFYSKIAPLVAKLNDGHTSVYPPNEEFNHYVKNGGLLFSFDLDFRDGKAFVSANYSSDSLVIVGSELLSINGIPIAKILDSLTQFISGEKASFRTEALERQFGRMLWLVYKFDQKYEVEFISPLTLERLTFRVNVFTREANRTKRSGGSKDKKPPRYAYYPLLGEKIGIIDFRSFRDLSQFKTFLKETFTQIQKDSIESLIIDIRKNPGGSDALGKALLSYITDSPFTQYSIVESKVSKQVLPWCLRWLPLQYLPPSARKISHTTEPKTPGENSLRFNGNVYVLISAFTASAAVGFAATVKDYKFGTLIGEETGGLATSYGDVYSFDLPRTRLEVGVSHKHFVRPSGEDDGRGVLPDHEVKQSIEDLKKGIDTVMEYTKELIKSNRGKTKKGASSNSLSLVTDILSTIPPKVGSG